MKGFLDLSSVSDCGFQLERLNQYFITNVDAVDITSL